MKNFYYKINGVVFQIISDPMPVRNEDGHDDICVVVKDTSNNKINVEEVCRIDSIESNELFFN